MRRFLAVVASVFVILVLLAPYAGAQTTPAPAAGPTPKVTINGLIDNVTSWNRNMSLRDLDASRVDKEWYARTRARPDITGELGTTKFVLGLELDYTWGATCPSGNDVSFRCSTEAGFGAPTTGAVGQRSGTFLAADINTDMPASLEVKWAYTEFALPWAPAGSIMRLGAQPFTVTHKLSALATGDFPGIFTSIVITPSIKINLTYAAIEERSTGVGDGFFRGDDFAVIGSVDLTPFKGIDLRPLFAWAQLNGATSSSTRQGRGGLAASTANFPTGGIGTIVPINQAGNPTAGAAAVTLNPANGGSAIENRYTVGLDAKWTFGPFYMDPTVMYQWGNRQFVVPGTATVPCTSPAAPAGTANAPGCVNLVTVNTGFKGANSLQKQDMNAWLFDIAGGWRAGPLLLEGRGSYSTGNKASQDVRDARTQFRSFQPISTDAQWWAGWGEISNIGIDYFNQFMGDDAARGTAPPFAIGYDKYGLGRVGVRASYALTPAFTVRMNAMQSWTAEKVDTHGVRSGGAGITPGNIGRAIGDGGSSNLGTEIDAGITWRFAPGLTFDLVAGYMWVGDAYKAALATSNFASAPLTVTASPTGNAAQNLTTAVSGLNRPDTDPHGVSTVAARVRYSF